MKRMNQPVPRDDEFAAVNARRLLSKLGGDKELLLEIIELFQREAPTLIDGLRAEAKNRDALAIARAAHVLKGSAANFGVNPLYELTRTIEHRARAGDLSSLDEHMAHLERTAQRFLQALEQMEGEVRS